MYLSYRWLFNGKIMDKKTALVTLLENSFWIRDAVKINILKHINTLTDVQIDILGRFLAEEQKYIVSHKDEIMANSNKILDAINNLVETKATTR
jgi:hypothetical protein